MVDLHAVRCNPEYDSCVFDLDDQSALCCRTFSTSFERSTKIVSFAGALPDRSFLWRRLELF